MSSVRRPAVAGMFYPADPRALRKMVRRLLEEAAPAEGAPKALVAPHAGYVYSGPVAASAYARLAGARDRLRRVVLLGPSHRVPLRGLAVSSADAFETPLGVVPMDRAGVAAALALPPVSVSDAAHATEHSLEVHLPFLQEALDEFTLVPVVVGEASAAEVAQVLEALWDGAETLVVISSDLSHYHDYETAVKIDRATSRAIERLDFEAVEGHQACGFHALRGLLHLARERGLRVTNVDLRNSGDTAGPRDQVVGYGAYVVTAERSD